MEIELFFSQYDNNEDNLIDEGEAQRIFRDLGSNKLHFTGVGAFDKHPDEFSLGGPDPPTQEEVDE